MLLHSLTLEAFGSYVGPTTIDFDAVSASGLFLLEGPTGSGKSTILDAITFALYGNVDGRKVINSRIQSDFVDEDVVPRVTLEFSAGGSRWHITRTAKRTEVGDDGLTTTKEHATAVLKKWVGDRWEGQTDKTGEAGVLVKSILNLNRDQFTQLVLLPQGDFARFMQAGEDERKAILSEIFRTTLFDKITAEVSEEAKRRRKNFTVREDATRLSLSASLAVAGVDDGTRDEILKFRGDELKAALSALGNDLTQKVTHCEATLKAATEAEKIVSRLKAEAEGLRDLIIRRQEAEQRLQEHEQGREQHKARSERVGRARKASALGPLLMTHAGLSERAGDLKAEILQLCLAEELSLSDVETLDGRKTDLIQLEGRLKGAAESEGALQKRREKLVELRGKLEQEKEKESRALGQLSELPDEEVLKRELEDAIALASEQESLDGKHQALSDLIKLEPQIAELQGLISTATDAMGLAEREFERLRAQYRRDIIADLRGSLVVGEPCPVCGSCEHKAYPDTLEELVSAQQVEDALEKWKADSKSLGELKLKLSELEAKKHGLAERIGAADEPWDVMSKRVAERLGASKDAAEAIPRIRQRLDQRAEQEENAREAAQNAQAAAAELEGQIKQVEVQNESDEQILATHRAEFANVQEHIGAVRQQLKEVDALLEYLGVVAELSKVETILDGMAKDAGFADHRSAAAAMIDDIELSELEAQVASWDLDREQFRAAATLSEFQAIGDATLEEMKAKVTGLTANHAETQSLLVIAQEAHTTARNAAADFARASAPVVEEIDDLEAERDLVDSVDHLDKMLRGMRGSRPMALTSFVLRRWFDRVVDAANLRLQQMSQGQYTLVRSESVARKRGERTGLGLAVLDNYTGKQRTARSLSGGETFYSSVALALGLVDVVQSEAGGAELNTLFIDEGFGTLDPKTRDLVMEVIENLRESGRVIGIVSHVEELKERIPEQIRVWRVDDGPSQVTLVC